MGFRRDRNDLMAGAMMALAGAKPGSGGGGGATTPFPAPVWVNVYATDVGSTNFQTINGITEPITLTVVDTGGSLLYYSQNGAYHDYLGGFTVSDGDVINWVPHNTTGARIAGAVTITNVTDSSATLATFNYSLDASGGY